QSNPSEDVTSRTYVSKPAFKKVLSHYDQKELRKGMDLLHKRVEKQFGQSAEEADTVYNTNGPVIAKQLVKDVWKERLKEYIATTELCKKIIETYYPEGVAMEFNLSDVNDAFAKHS